MKTPVLRSLAALAAILVLAACEDKESQINFGSKNFSESRIMAHMMAEVAKEQGLPVAGVIEYPNTQAVQEALKRGDIDAYQEFNGTALVMIGQNPMTDGDASMERVEELYQPLGLTWRPRIGFANDYGLAMRTERASELGLTSMSDLVAVSDQITLGIEDDFERRPLDGLQPMLLRYGFEFAETDVVPLEERAELYDRLLDGQVDVIEVYTTDGQIADYGLTLLEDDLSFFPVYQAAILARADSLAQHPGLGAALDLLVGKIDNDAMRDLNRKVDIEGRQERDVARDALARLDLISSGAAETEDPLIIATSPFLSDGGAANVVLRAARSAFPGRNVQLQRDDRPLQQVTSGDARLAVVGASALFDTSTPANTRDEAFEALVPVGQELIHLVALRDGPARLSDATKIATGPEGSNSQRLAEILSAGLGLDATIVSGEVEDTDAAIAQVRDGSVDVALIPAPEGDSALELAFTDGDLRLLSIDGWNRGANLLRYPFLRQNRIQAGEYQGQRDAVETLGSQLVLVGPAPDTSAVVGDQGPSSIAVGLSPVSGDAVLALNAAVPGVTFVDPTLKQAEALIPELPTPPAAISPSPDISILSLLIVVMLVWMIWLYTRPDYR